MASNDTCLDDDRPYQEVPLPVGRDVNWNRLPLDRFTVGMTNPLFDHTINSIYKYRLQDFYRQWMIELLINGNAELLINFYGYLVLNGEATEVLASSIPSIVELIKSGDLSNTTEVYSADLFQVFVEYTFERKIKDLFIEPETNQVYYEWMPV